MPIFQTLCGDTRKLCCIALSTFLFAFLHSAPTFAADYYIKNDGNDALDGSSDATAWRTLDNLGSRVEDGARVFLRAGDVWHDSTLNISWAGTSNQNALVSCYVVTNGREVECNPAIHIRPEINGTFEASCQDDLSCDLNNGNAVPESISQALVDVRRSNVTVRNLALRDSAGAFAQSARDLTNIVFDNLVMERSAHRIITYGRGNTYVTMMNSTATDFNRCTWKRFPACEGKPWPGGVMVSDSQPAHALFENNTITDGYGEGFICLRASHVIMRENRVGNIRSARYYLDNCKDSVVERNIAWGDDTNEFWRGTGVAIAVEDYRADTAGDSVRLTVRNNLLSGLRNCVSGGMKVGSKELGRVIGAKIYGNTCVDPYKFALDITVDASNVDEWDVQNNIFYAPNTAPPSSTGFATGEPCRVPSSSRIAFAGNLWNREPADTDCRGSGDIIGSPRVKTAISQFRGMDSSNPPTVEDFRLNEGSPAIGAGVRLQQTVLDADDHPISNAGESQCKTLDERQLSQDFDCRARNATPTMGALLLNSALPRPLPPIILLGN